ncbi:hypothetical protein L6452_22669 [Arctium lappa]|uniref:Uncharacterized protein n=1 Tax=Arctium lappa TaxID=4217 RepID=A0ACB9B257_ARCLA|nr:hypothetical protein L6452_22669 [Arctium lappa]
MHDILFLLFLSRISILILLSLFSLSLSLSHTHTQITDRRTNTVPFRCWGACSLLLSILFLNLPQSHVFFTKFPSLQPKPLINYTLIASYQIRVFQFQPVSDFLLKTLLILEQFSI